MSGPSQNPPSAQSPFARIGCYLLRRDVLRPVRGHYSSFIAHTDSCARPNSSYRLRLLIRQVFAGCCRPLLEDGPSRCYLLSLCVGARTPTPQRLSGALVRFFPKSFGLTLHQRGSALVVLPPPCNFYDEHISGLQPFLYVQAPTLARPPGCTHRRLTPTYLPDFTMGGWAVYTTQ
jgi:hypothetical protein